MDYLGGDASKQGKGMRSETGQEAGSTGVLMSG